MIRRVVGVESSRPRLILDYLEAITTFFPAYERSHFPIE